MMLTLGYGGVKKRKVVMQEEEEEFIVGTKQIEQIEQNEFSVLPLSTPDWN